VEDRPLAEQLRRVFGVGLDDLAGATISGEIPLPNDLINRLIAQRLAASPSAIATAVVDAQDNDNVAVELSMRGPKLLPSVRIAARIDRQPDLPHAPVLGLRWSLRGMGPLGSLAALALTWLKALPPGIRADGDRIDLDIADVLRSQGLGELLACVAALQVHTRRGAFVVRFELRVR